MALGNEIELYSFPSDLAIAFSKIRSNDTRKSLEIKRNSKYSQNGKEGEKSCFIAIRR